jgi:hypothetical protein
METRHRQRRGRTPPPNIQLKRVLAILALLLPAVGTVSLLGGVGLDPKTVVVGIGLLCAAVTAALAVAGAMLRMLVGELDLRSARLNFDAAEDKRATAALDRQRAAIELDTAMHRRVEDEEPPPPPVLAA